MLLTVTVKSGVTVYDVEVGLGILLKPDVYNILKAAFSANE